MSGQPLHRGLVENPPLMQMLQQPLLPRPVHCLDSLYR